jgi:hypothetical protein
LPMVISLLKANMRSDELAPACFAALGALSAHESTAPIVAASEALSLVSAWVEDNQDDAPKNVSLQDLPFDYSNVPYHFLARWPSLRI